MVPRVPAAPKLFVPLKRLWRQSAHRAAPCSLRRSTGHVVFPAVHGRCTELPGDPRRGSDPRRRRHHATQPRLSAGWQTPAKPTVRLSPAALAAGQSMPQHAHRSTVLGRTTQSDRARSSQVLRPSTTPPRAAASASGSFGTGRTGARVQCPHAAPIYRCCVCWTRLARRLRRARRDILTCHRMHCSLWLQTEREAGLVHLALRPSADPQATI